MKKEQAKELSDLEIAWQRLKKEKKLKKKKELFKEICDLLDYNEDHFINMLADFYTSLNLDKRFILLDGKWELKEHHSIKTVVEDELNCCSLFKISARLERLRISTVSLRNSRKMSRTPQRFSSGHSSQRW